jgi:hypothetical protein
MVILKTTLAIAVIATAACYSWDPNGQPCRQEGSGAALSFACDSGYSCLRKDGVAKTACVRDASRKRGEECSADQMCVGGLNCVDGLCREACGANYFSSSTCRTNEWCKPYANEATGFCSPSECLNTTCPTGRICATLKDNVGACLVECTPSFNDGQYSDNCGSTSGENYCQAVGSSGDRRLVCLDTDKAGQAVGTFCNAIDNPCAADQSFQDGGGQTHKFGLTCVTGTCRELCDPTLPNPQTNTTDCPGSIASGAQYCCSQLGATNGGGQTIQWGVCIPTAAECNTAHYPDG